jgi:arsenate reductase (glutaredoxin)
MNQSLANTTFPVVIFHNPDCGTSRNVVATVIAAGYQPQIIYYLEMGWTRGQLLAFFAVGGLTPRTALRDSKSPAKELGLLDGDISEEAILEAMLAHPILVNRPLVATPKGIALCRPSEAVLDLLEKFPPGPFYKEDGQLLIDENGMRCG